jgi:hypothetical protein
VYGLGATGKKLFDRHFSGTLSEYVTAIAFVSSVVLNLSSGFCSVVAQFVLFLQSVFVLLSEAGTGLAGRKKL